MPFGLPSSLNSGSSPHERGTVAQKYKTHLRMRFIPARAGNRSRSSSPPGAMAVHPRTSGEQLEHLHVPAAAVRFIPARAGNRGRTAQPRRPGAVHPRTSGEQIFLAQTGPSANGSSPHERGTVLDAACKRKLDRFIPARAGNRTRAACASIRPAVHPRTSGEQ